MEHESSDTESDINDTEDQVADMVIVESTVDDVDHTEPDWRQFATNYKGFQLETTQQSLTTDLFTAVKAEKG